jgi:hypothetical protein
MTLLLLAACSDHGLTNLTQEPPVGDPAVVVTPAALDFGVLGPGETRVLEATIASVGAITLDVEEIAVAGNGPFTLVDAAPMTLVPGESVAVTVVFTPAQAGQVDGVLGVRSTDPVTPWVEVPLRGDADVPDLQVSSLDVGQIPVGCVREGVLSVQNVGTMDATVSSAAFVGDGAYTVEAVAPQVLAPMDYLLVPARFAPVAVGVASGTLTVESDSAGGARTGSLRGEGVGVAGLTERFEVPVDPPTDILFAIDQSGSMDDDAMALAENFGAFTRALEVTTTDWRVGIVTLDDGCFNGGVLDAATPDLAGEVAAAVALGTDAEATYDERLLQLVSRALVAPCNAGFPRAGALLHAIVVSDEPERSVEDAAAWTWDHWLARIQLAAPGVVISGVVDQDRCNAGDRGYAEAIAATGGERRSLCGAEWADDLAAIADVARTRPRRFVLAELPDPATIHVTVNGVSAAWTWDPRGNAVGVRADPGAVVVVTYAQEGTCP